MPHLGHLVQSPSGMSRLRPFVETGFGFLANGTAGGVVAGTVSVGSRPSIFLVNEVVAILESGLRALEGRFMRTPLCCD